MNILPPLTRKLRQLAALAFLFVPLAAAQQPTVRIGIVLDGPSDQNDRLLQIFEGEITVLLEDEFDVQFPARKRLVADWTAAGVKHVVDQLLSDDDVDHVVTLGILGSNDVCRRGPLPKPVFAAIVLDPEIHGIPFETLERTLPGEEVERLTVSGVTNLSYVTYGGDPVREVTVFRDIVPFSRLTVLYMQALTEAIPDLDRKIDSVVQPSNLEIDTVPVGVSLDQALAAIPANTEAVFVTPLWQLSSSDFERLAQALIERKLPSFSTRGRDEVEQGLLATLWPRQNPIRRARRVGLNIQQVLAGVPAAELPVEFSRSETLTINMATARAIGVSPTFYLMTEAELLNEEPARAARTVSLSDVVREASQVNLDLLVADRNVAAGLQLVRQARARLLPQLSISGSGSVIDKDRADQLLGLNPERRGAAGTSFHQLIYSDDVKAGYDIERNLQDLRFEERAELRLDVILEAAESYLNVLRSKTIERIQKNNLGLTRSNLELAQARVEIGQAGRDELFRWESQISTNRKDVVEASAVRSQAEIAVNRVLNRPIEETFFTVEAGLDDPELVTSFEQIRPYIESPGAFDLFQRFVVRDAFANSPELKQFDAVIVARERELTASKRAFYVPSVEFTASLEYFGRGGVGGKPLPESPIAFANQTNWNLFASANLPLFQGGGMRARRSRAGIELEEVTLQREAARQRIEARIRSVLHQTSASFVGIDLTRDAAEAAHRNLELVTDRYAAGIVDILRLLDAQTQALAADLAAANTVFDYLIDLMGTQHAVGRFDYYRSPDDRQTFLNELRNFFDASGYTLRNP